AGSGYGGHAVEPAQARGNVGPAVPGGASPGREEAVPRPRGGAGGPASQPAPTQIGVAPGGVRGGWRSGKGAPPDTPAGRGGDGVARGPRRTRGMSGPRSRGHCGAMPRSEERRVGKGGKYGWVR